MVFLPLGSINNIYYNNNKASEVDGQDHKPKEGYASALTTIDNNNQPLPTWGRSAGRKQVTDDEEYLTPSDDE